MHYITRSFNWQALLHWLLGVLDTLAEKAHKKVVQKELLQAGFVPSECMRMEMPFHQIAWNLYDLWLRRIAASAVRHRSPLEERNAPFRQKMSNKTQLQLKEKFWRNWPVLRVASRPLRATRRKHKLYGRVGRIKWGASESFAGHPSNPTNGSEEASNRC